MCRVAGEIIAKDDKSITIREKHNKKLSQIFSMKTIIHKHKLCWSQNNFCWNAGLSVVLLVVSLFANYFANVYVAIRASNTVTDLILDNVPVINIRWIFFQGAALFFLFMVWLLIREPNKIPFVLKSAAVFILIRSVFITLTHLAVPPQNLLFLNWNTMFNAWTSGNDLFFSSHTGMPFLMALIFWNNKRLRIFFIAVSLIFGVSVLLGHVHYSIDVFAAFFITYGIFHITQWLFPKDYKLFLEEEKI